MAHRRAEGVLPDRGTQTYRQIDFFRLRLGRWQLKIIRPAGDYPLTPSSRIPSFRDCDAPGLLWQRDGLPAGVFRVKHLEGI
jgi:hypothetical protein